MFVNDTFVVVKSFANCLQIIHDFYNDCCERYKSHFIFNIFEQILLQMNKISIH